MQRCLFPRHFYDLHPEGSSTTGDIWKELPTFGILKCPRCSAIVITPSCDLANQKTDTITYLPILPVTKWFQLPVFLGVVKVHLRPLLRKLGLEASVDSDILESRPPSCEALSAAARITDEAMAKANSPKHRDIAHRIKLGLRHMELIASTSFSEYDVSSLTEFFGHKHWASMCQQIVTNAYRTDLHFLPADENDADWSAIPVHSVVLFRYPITVPIQTLQMANDISLHDWEAAISGIPAGQPIQSAFRGHRPLKTMRLNLEFLSDLLTRYTSLYNRLGSPDFAPVIVTELRNQIGE